MHTEGVLTLSCEFSFQMQGGGQRSDTVQQIKEPCLRVFPGFFRGPHREGESPPYAEKVLFRRAGIKKANAVILCCYNNQTNGNSQLRVP